MSKKIYISAGHGGNDPGAVNGTRLEKNDALRFALSLESRLKAQGFDTKQARSTDTAVTLTNRTNSANSWGADFFISIHRNSFTNATANGIEVFVFPGVTGITRSLANSIYNGLVGVYAQSKRGVKESNFHVLRETKMSAVLIELGFISNTIDNQKFDEHFDAYVEGTVKAVCEQFGVAYKPESGGSTPPSTEKLFRVQAGAFKEKVNAEKCLQEAKDKGFSDSFIIES